MPPNTVSAIPKGTSHAAICTLLLCWITQLLDRYCCCFLLSEVRVPLCPQSQHVMTLGLRHYPIIEAATGPEFVFSLPTAQQMVWSSA